MALDVREILWGSASGIADLVDAHVAAPLTAPVELEVQLNGAALPHVARYYAGIMLAGALPADARILDLGCGYGRIGMQMAQYLGAGQHYFGLDPNADAIAWARQHVVPLHPNLSFERIDVHSLPYNPDGQFRGSQFRFPFDDGSLDRVFMVSVLTHVDLSTLATYVREARRTLKPDSGRLIATIFLLDEEVDALIGDGRSSFTFPWPHGPSRVQDPANPELAIAHPRQAVMDLLADAGFAQVQVCNGHWSGRSAPPLDYQDLLVADLGAGTVYRHVAVESPDVPPEEHRFPPALLERIDAADFGSRDHLLAFVAWGAALTINALWWQQHGWTLRISGGAGDGDAGADSAEPARLAVARFRALGLDLHEPTTSRDEPRFHPLDDAGIVDLLCRTGRRAEAGDVLCCIFDAVANGFVVADAMRAWQALVLFAPGSTCRSAPIPPFNPA